MRTDGSQTTDGGRQGHSKSSAVSESLPTRRSAPSRARWARWIALLVGTSWLPACGSTPVVVKQLPSAVVARRPEAIDPRVLDAAVGGRDGEAYRVGPGDRLLVAVYGHPELSITGYAGSSFNAVDGLRVDNDGTIQFPLIGSVKVAGKTSEDLRVYLQEQLGVYVKDPKVTVQIVFAGSIRYYLLGQFTAPGLKESDRPVRLLEALSLGGSVVLERASLRSAYIARDGKRLPIDFRSLILEGDLRQNIKMRSGDIILVPDKSSEQAFVFGGSSGGTVVPFVNGRLTLLQALAQAGFSYRDRVRGRLGSTRVIRSTGASGELFTVDAEMILDGEAGPFDLAPGDVVYVPPTAFTSWNEALQQLLPTLQTVSSLLTPFVQIKYLSE